jgi:hypothetical protein
MRIEARQRLVASASFLVGFFVSRQALRLAPAPKPYGAGGLFGSVGARDEEECAPLREGYKRVNPPTDPLTRTILPLNANCKGSLLRTRAHVCALDKGKTGGCTLARMARVLTIALAVVVILSCATVLITPDPTDNISGILNQHSVRGHKLLVAPAGGGSLKPFVVAAFHLLGSPPPTLHSSTPHLLALVCVRLC